MILSEVSKFFKTLTLLTEFVMCENEQIQNEQIL